MEAGGDSVVRCDVHALNREGWRGRGLIDLVGLVRGMDKLVVHYQSGLFYSKRGVPGLKSLQPYRGLLRVLEASKRTEFIVHEEYRPYLTPFVRWQRSLVHKVFRKAAVAFVHTRHELEAFQVPVRRLAVLDPAAYYESYTGKSRKAARKALGEGTVFLAAGFYHPGKGFERLLEAFKGLGGPAKLVVLTSDREGNYAPGLAKLRQMASKARNVSLLEGYVTDEVFDSWIVASDYVVVPYVYGFTSSLLARAKIHGKPAIVSDLPTLREQAGPRDHLFKDEEELAAIIRDLTT